VQNNTNNTLPIAKPTSVSLPAMPADAQIVAWDNADIAVADASIDLHVIAGIAVPPIPFANGPTEVAAVIATSIGATGVTATPTVADATINGPNDGDDNGIGNVDNGIASGGGDDESWDRLVSLLHTMFLANEGPPGGDVDGAWHTTGIRRIGYVLCCFS
jgi:hypothetical protein